MKAWARVLVDEGYGSTFCYDMSLL